LCHKAPALKPSPHHNPNNLWTIYGNSLESSAQNKYYIQAISVVGTIASVSAMEGRQNSTR
jgi:hypothetical protein